MLRRAITEQRWGLTMTLLNCTREYNTRGIPYRPKGEPMEMPGSPRHFAMQQVLSKEKLQRETAEAVLRQQGRPQGGPQYTPHAAEGRPLTMGAPVVPDFESVMNGLGSSGGEGYKQDVRANPAYENVPEHVLAARERMSSMEVDSFGPASRRMVRPPPPILDDAPRAYFAPRVELPAWWWGLMAFFMATFYVLNPQPITMLRSLALFQGAAPRPPRKLTMSKRRLMMKGNRYTQPGPSVYVVIMLVSIGLLNIVMSKSGKDDNSYYGK